MMIVALRKVIKRMHYPLEVMLTCVRWYAAYPLSLRDVEEMMAERGTGCRQDQKRPASERIHAAPSTPCPALRCLRLLSRAWRQVRGQVPGRRHTGARRILGLRERGQAP